LRPRRDRLGPLRDRLASRLVHGWYDRKLAGLNALRARAGAPPLAHVTQVLERAQLLLAFTAEPFEYPRSDWHPSVRLVGPGLWDPPAEPPPWLAALDRPLVLVTASTEYQADEKLIEVALDALGCEPVTVVATTGAVDPARFAPPANARVSAFLPHGPLLERAACLVCHGGMGVTQKALAAGVPVCVVPFGRDQFEVARRVLEIDAGTRLPARRLSARRLRHAVRQTLAHKPQAEAAAAALARAPGPNGAADELERLPAARPPSQEPGSHAPTPTPQQAGGRQ
jgi:MGT family glycosyltransferase